MKKYIKIPKNLNRILIYLILGTLLLLSLAALWHRSIQIAQSALTPPPKVDFTLYRPVGDSGEFYEENMAFPARASTDTPNTALREEICAEYHIACDDWEG